MLKYCNCLVLGRGIFQYLNYNSSNKRILNNNSCNQYRTRYLILLSDVCLYKI